MKATRAIDASTPRQDALYVERLSRLLPTYSITAPVEDCVVLGYWLTGGANVSAEQFRRLRQMMSWLSATDLMNIVQTAGVRVDVVVPDVGPHAIRRLEGAPGSAETVRSFSLPGDQSDFRYCPVSFHIASYREAHRVSPAHELAT
jgi:hypothetical protein